MPSIRFQLELPLRRVEEHVRTAYGTAARIVSVREVRTGGIGGFFAHRALDVVVDVPEPDGAPTAEPSRVRQGAAPAGAPQGIRAAGPGESPRSGGATAGSTVSGLAGLLADADAGDTVGRPAGGMRPDPTGYAGPTELPTRRSARAAESAQRAEAGYRTEQPTISTQSRRFEEVMGGVQAEFGPPKPPVPETIRIAPALSRLAGDLVVIAGLSADAAGVTDSLAAARGPYLRAVGGALPGSAVRADDRRGAIGLRAAGVERGLPALVAYGLGPGGSSLSASIDALRSLAPDQVWLVVDVSRKPEDTVRWVSAVRAALPVDAIAVVHGAFTASDHTASTLGLPEGWSDAGR